MKITLYDFVIRHSDGREVSESHEYLPSARQARLMGRSYITALVNRGHFSKYELTVEVRELYVETEYE